MTSPIKLTFSKLGCHVRVMDDGTLRYHYRANLGAEGVFPLLSEVGEPWQDTFKALINEQGLNIQRGVDIETEPYCADVLLGYYVHDEYFDLARVRQDRAPWIICPTCSGEGKSSRHLGAYSAEEFDEAFGTPEEKEDYFNGMYDVTCNTCGGSGKVKDCTEAWTKHNNQLNLERGVNDAGERLW